MCAINLMHEIRKEAQPSDTPVIVSGCIGPRGDGYVVGSEMTVDQAAAYHRPQLEAFKSAGAEMEMPMRAIGTAKGMKRLLFIMDLLVRIVEEAPPSILGEALPVPGDCLRRRPGEFSADPPHQTL